MSDLHLAHLALQSRKPSNGDGSKLNRSSAEPIADGDRPVSPLRVGRRWTRLATFTRTTRGGRTHGGADFPGRLLGGRLGAGPPPRYSIQIEVSGGRSRSPAGGAK